MEYYQPEAVGIKLSPVTDVNDQYDENPEETYTYLVQELDKKNVGFIEVREPSPTTEKPQIENVSKLLRPHFKGILIANESFTSEKGLEFINNGWADMVSFGRLYISNPDLAERLINKQKLNESFDYKTMTGNFLREGYIDYPFYEEWIKTQEPKQ